MSLSQPLDEYLMAFVRKHGINLIPDELVINTGKIFERIFQGYPNPQLAVSAALASTYTWCFDSIWDDLTLPLEVKHQRINEQRRLLDPFELYREIPTDNLPPISILLVEAINGIIRTSQLTGMDRYVIKEQARRSLDALGYELFYEGELPAIEELFYFGSYNYIIPFYGSMIYAADYHFHNMTEYQHVDQFMYAFGLVGRLYNDLRSYERERALDELNIVLVLEKQLGSLEAALEQTDAYIEQAYAEYHRAKANVPAPAFIDIIDRFEQAINDVYRVKDFRELDRTELDNFPYSH